MGILGICKIHSFLKKCFFIPNSNNAFTLNFSQNINKSKVKVWKFRSHRLTSFSAINKTITGVKVGERVSFFSYYHCFCLYI